MPSGMLVPVRAGDGGAVDPADPFRLARGKTGGAWIELQVARGGDTPERRAFARWAADSWFVSLSAMTLLHEPFARALPGFDLFLPRLFAPSALVALERELEAFARGAPAGVASTARELATLARDTAARNESLWVLGL
jgi:hypothetical protein